MRAESCQDAKYLEDRDHYEVITDMWEMDIASEGTTLSYGSSPQGTGTAGPEFSDLPMYKNSEAAYFDAIRRAQLRLHSISEKEEKAGMSDSVNPAGLSGGDDESLSLAAPVNFR